MIKSMMRMRHIFALCFFYLLDPSGARAAILGVDIDSSVPKEVKDKLKIDLKYMKSIRGSNASDIHRRVFGNRSMNGTDYMKFFHKRVKVIRYKTAFYRNFIATASGDSEKIMYITPNYLNNVGRLSRPFTVQLFLHEAHHNDPHGNQPHSYCPDLFVDESGKEHLSSFTGLPLAGTLSCDDQIAGAYPLSIIVAGNIAKFCTTCTSDEKAAATEIVDELLVRIIDVELKSVLIDDLQWTGRLPY